MIWHQCVIKDLFTILYADDSNLFNHGPCLKELELRINRELQNVSDWLKLNKLSLNIDKTHFIIFKRPRKIIDYEPCLYIDSIPISRVKETKFLGVFIDEHLTWHRHVNYISSKIAKGIGILHKARKFLNKQTLHQLYYTFIYPYLSYCNHVWGNTHSTQLSRLVLLQK